MMEYKWHEKRLEMEFIVNWCYMNKSNWIVLNRHSSTFKVGSEMHKPHDILRVLPNKQKIMKTTPWICLRVCVRREAANEFDVCA